jgi:hypothetical protein
VYLYLDDGNTALPDIGNFLVREVAADNEGENIALVIVEPVHGRKNVCRLFLGDIVFFLTRDSVNTVLFFGYKALVETQMIIEKIAAHGEEECRAVFAVAIAFQVTGKGLLRKIGGQMDITGLAEKIPEEFVSVIDIELAKSVHSGDITLYLGKGYTVSLK